MSEDVFKHVNSETTKFSSQKTSEDAIWQKAKKPKERKMSMRHPNNRKESLKTEQQPQSRRPTRRGRLGEEGLGPPAGFGTVMLVSHRSAKECLKK